MNQQLFQSMVFVHRDKMYRFAKRLLSDEEEAYDTVQDVMMKLWQMKDDLHQYKNIEAFTMRCIINECLNKQKHAKVVEKYQVINRPEPTTEWRGGNTKEIILAMINQLPEKQKMVMHLKDVEEYDVNEIAEMIEMDEGAVRVNLMRARQKIKSQLENIFNYEKRQLGRI